ncbi:biopolymer transporter ExbD [Ferruginibacter sp. HRS2-29]|uniref:ExbD/TolR family protein n=1 Tax=Ferruginibacter sp. HRS2-29 TaxID=2487334 RepID=UPI0020CC4D59|nr:biopolymer transporter ExbD [Ferruginibacter sp. HRS2-29]MCP9750271.1 biopolymer transporter ExbD [Ferruginibacter sp. HRS2-29]
MAEITTNSSSKQKGGVKRMIKKSTRVDLTPMVDLGFLLVTFFVFTTTMAEPKAMKIVMPNDQHEGGVDKICETCALTVVLGDNNKILYYEGLDENAVYKQTDYTAEGIRSIIVRKKAAVKKALGQDRMMLIIKASDGASMKNLVNVIDESAISSVKRYYMAELKPKDKEALQ